MDIKPYTEAETKAMDHIVKMCATQFKAASSYLAFMKAVKLRVEIEGYTPPLNNDKPNPKPRSR